jgi:hypothetical protein
MGSSVPAHMGAFAQSVHIPTDQSERPEHGVIVFAIIKQWTPRSRAAFSSERCARDPLPSFFSAWSQESKRPYERSSAAVVSIYGFTALVQRGEAEKAAISPSRLARRENS